MKDYRKQNVKKAVSKLKMMKKLIEFTVVAKFKTIEERDLLVKYLKRKKIKFKC